MNILVTGGAGFIGSNIVRFLLKERHSVTIIDNLSSGCESNLQEFPNIKFILGDIRDEKALLNAIKGVEIVFHLAASVGNKRSIDSPIEDSEINVLGTLKLLEAAKKEGVRKIVYSSSAGIFGELKSIPIREDHPVEPDSPYGASKLCGEKMCLAYGKLYDLGIVCLRYFNVYGTNQRYDAYGNVIPIFVNNVVKGLPVTIYGNGEQTRDFINVSDVARANVYSAFSEKANGVYNLGSGSRISINLLAEIIFKAADVPPEIEYGPPRIGDVLHSLADISKAKLDFGFEPEKELTEGLEEYIKWFRNELL